MTDQQGDQRILAEALDRFIKKSDQLLNTGNRNTAHIEVNAGGLGLWAAVTACLVMLAVLAVAIPVGVGAYIVTQNQIQALENTDNAIRAYINTGKMPPLPKK